MPDIKKYLNRDGLDEYNSLLPHSRGEMQTYVNDWLDEHPEATTTVQDGAISEPKLADKSVSLRTLADDTVHMLKGAILTGNLSGNVLTADDAYSAPPVALTVEGKSTQDGTPTPESPVEIVSLEQANLTFAGKNLLNPATCIANKFLWYDGSLGSGAGWYATDYINAAANTTYMLTGNTATSATAKFCFYDSSKNVIDSINAQASNRTFTTPDGTAYVRLSIKTDSINTCQFEIGATATTYAPYVEPTNIQLNLTQALRSLPDGTHDELSFAYLRPSTREGWAWFTPTQTQNVRYARLTNFSQFATLSNGHHRVRHGTIANAGATHSISNRFVYNSSTYNYGNPGDYYISSGYMYCIVPDELTTLEAVNEWAANNVSVLQFAASPEVTTLDPIELPFVAAPDFTIWSDPTTGLQMQYMRDSSLVIQRIEQAIADQ